MLRATDVLTAVAELLSTKYAGVPVYSREIFEGFDKPAFFVNIVRTTNARTENFSHNEMSILLYYFAADDENREIEFMDIVDDCRVLFGRGLRAADRYLHTREFEDERVGEREDILLIIVRFEFLDSTGRTDPDEGYDIMKRLEMKFKGKAGGVNAQAPKGVVNNG